MPRVATVPADLPLAERVRRGFSYPLRGSALATCIALALAHYVALLPVFIGLFGAAAVWMATWRYAADCMQHTAHGYADPPDVGIDGDNDAGWALTAIHLFAVDCGVLAGVFFPALLWPLVVVFALILPAIDMALAFDANLALALNPAHLARVVAGFGTAYLVPVAINLLLGVLIVAASVATAALPRLLAVPVFAFLCNYLVFLAFHLMGGMLQQRREHFGIEARAEALAETSGQDQDGRLAAQARELATDDPQAALRLLAGRLQDRAAPPVLHETYRDLLRQQGMREALLVHGQIWIAALTAGGEARRALRLVQECTDLDPSFLPDDPGHAGVLAEAAARHGMNRMAARLCRGFLDAWPGDTRAPEYALLGARLLGAPLGQPGEALVLLGRLGTLPADHPKRAEVATLAAQLGQAEGIA
ncbi:hypothetical protein [Fulvimonas yonginensis]|uniref:Tetratricopeptide repeat protein n=1 Tax=Fulvimonas yonginensis TaxID=1495200 RepID=A0ABU8JCP9_9GAMM